MTHRIRVISCINCNRVLMPLWCVERSVWVLTFYQPSVVFMWFNQDRRSEWPSMITEFWIYLPGMSCCCLQAAGTKWTEDCEAVVDNRYCNHHLFTCYRFFWCIFWAFLISVLTVESKVVTDRKKSESTTNISGFKRMLFFFFLKFSINCFTLSQLVIRF